MRLIAVVLACLFFAALDLWVEACPPAHTRTKVAVVPAVVAAPAAVILVPTYSVSYIPTPLAAAPVAGQPAAQNPPPATSVPDQGDGKLLGQAFARCASCHSFPAADAKGGGFVLINKDNKLVPLSLNERRSIAGRIASTDPKRQMPPPGAPQLASEEKQALTNYLPPPAKKD